MAAYQPRGYAEAPAVLPFGGSNVVAPDPALREEIRLIAQRVGLHADFARMPSVREMSTAYVPPPPRPSPDMSANDAPPDRYDVLSFRLSPTEVFTRWIVGGFAIGIAAALLIMRAA